MKNSKKKSSFTDLQLFQLEICISVFILLVAIKLAIPSLMGGLKDTYADIAAKTGVKEYREVLDGAIDAIKDRIKLPKEQAVFAAESKETGFKNELARPLEETNVTYEYGFRADPFTGECSFHSGTDYAAAKGTAVKCAAIGRIVKIGYTSVYGNFVTVRHDRELVTFYAHLESVDTFLGEIVSAGSVIGRVGSTGRSTGYHLHFEIIRGGYRVDPETEYGV